MKRNRISLGLIFLASSLILSACGGGSSSSATSTPTATTLTGTAAAGAPIIGQVTVKGALGNTKSALIEANGTYSVDVTGLTAPYRLRAEGTVGGRTVKLYSYAESADVGGTVNITPFTDLIVANAAQQIASNFFDSQTTTSLNATVVAEQEAALQTKLQAVLDAVGVGAAVDLLHTTFSADHSALDAALDAVRIEVDTGTNVATITNVLDTASTPISFTALDMAADTSTLTVSDPTTITTAVTDNQAIAAIADGLSQAFASGLPAATAIQDYFSADFYSNDQSKNVFLTDITTDPSLVGLTFSGFAISDLNSTLGTAKVTLYAGGNGFVNPIPETWFVSRDSTLGWQLRGDQRVADMYFDFHCNDYDDTDTQTGSCGINTQFTDNDFNNNGTVSNAPIASGTVSILDGTNTANVKAVIYLGTPANGTAGEVVVYDEANQGYSGDYKGFGTGTGEIDPSIFQVGDIIEYKLYTEALDISNPTAPQIASSAVPVATYQDTLLFTPATTGAYPTATADTLTAINNFTLGNNLTVVWTPAAGMLADEVLVRISDASGNKIEVWDSSMLPTATTTTIASTALDSTAASTAGLDANAASYTLLVRIYTIDPLNGQFHSTDYSATIPGPGATSGSSGNTGSGSTFACSYESGWNDAADGGLGAPINPNSFADYEAVIAACGTAQTFTAADIAGKTFQEMGTVETTTFNTGTGTAASPATGTYDDGAGATINFQWYVEAATCTGCNYNYLVLYSDTTIDSTLPLAWLRETTALAGITGTPGAAGAQYAHVKYSEAANYSDGNRASGSDGEIWNAVDVLQ